MASLKVICLFFFIFGGHQCCWTWYGIWYLTPGHCYNGGTCNYNSTGNNYYCVCNQGWDQETYCLTVDPCWNVTCHNGGTCMKNVSEHYCVCNTSLDPATNCQTEINVDPCDDRNTAELQNLEIRTSSTSNAGLSDQNLAKKWYKTYGYEMTTHDPGNNRCGSKSPIYLKETIPSDPDVYNLTACVRDQENTCATNFSVPVKKCEADTIFLLSPTQSSDSSYCFDEVDLSDKATTWTPSSINVNFNMTWTDAEVAMPALVYRCNFTFSTGKLWYKIKWYINDINVTESVYVQKELVGKAENTTLTEKYIQRYGVTIKCSVTAAYSPVSPPGVETKSPGFYAGMKLHTPIISVERGQSGHIIMEPTIPYGCPQYLSVCKTRILMTNPHSRNKCENSQITSTQNNRCGLEIEGGLKSNTEWFSNELWRKNYTFGIRHREEDQRYIPRKTSYTLELKFEKQFVPIHPTWSSTYLDNVVVNVYITETWMNKKCYAVIDPHMRTFDGRIYEMQMEGTFMFYKHTERNASVIIKTTSCWSPRIFCICGIVVQAGKDLFVINTCPTSIPMMRFYRCNEGLIRVYSHGEHLYKIYLPTGTRVEAHLRGYGTRYWDVYIYPTNIDVGKTSGLCGTLDGFCSNDFVLRNGSYSTTTGARNPCSVSNGWLWYPNDFSDSWRVTDDENLFPGPMFDTVYNALSPWSISLQLCYCPYNSQENHTDTKGLYNEAQCSYKEYADCNYDPGREKVCRHHQSRSLRYRKSDTIFNYHAIMKPHDRNILQKRSTSMATIDATTACNTIFNESITYRKCEDIDLIDEAVLELCIQDLVATGDVSVAYSHRERGKSECVDLLTQNDTLREEYSDVVAVIESNNCPNECSNHGLCVAGNCTCDIGFAAKDCSMNLTGGVDINGNSENGFCDTSDGLCEEIEVYGEPFPEDIQPVSSFTPFTQGVENRTKVFYSPIKIQGEQQSRFSAYFKYPTTTSWPKPILSNSSFVYGYTFAVTLDGSIFSEESTIYVHDSTCQTYRNAADSIVFLMKSGYCFINGVCLSNGTVNPSQSCQLCNATKKKYEWSYHPKCVVLSGSDDDDKIQAWVIVVITVVLLGIVLTITIVVVKKFVVKRSDKNAIGNFKGTSDRYECPPKPNLDMSLFMTDNSKQEQDNVWAMKYGNNQTTEKKTIVED